MKHRTPPRQLSPNIAQGYLHAGDDVWMLEQRGLTAVHVVARIAGRL